MSEDDKTVRNETFRRTVELSERVRRGSGGKTRLWAYGYADLAALFGVSQWRVRQMARKKDLGNLKVVVAEVLRLVGR